MRQLKANLVFTLQRPCVFFDLCIALSRYKEIHLEPEMEKTFETFWFISLILQTEKLSSRKIIELFRLILKSLAELFLGYISLDFCTIFPLQSNTSLLFCSNMSAYVFPCLLTQDFFLDFRSFFFFFLLFFFL